MSMRLWDAAVIGGGPAGCSAAISLARKGLQVILLEAGTYPHDKMCGEFLSPECAPLLRQLGVLDQGGVKEAVEITRAVFTARNGQAWEARLPGKALGISRKTLDAALAEQAQRDGVLVREATVVSEVSGNLRDGFALDARCRGQGETISARCVIGAYGKRSSLDKKLRRSFIDRPHPFLAFKAHFEGPRIPNRVEMHLFPGGYCGISEIEGDARVACFLVREPVFQRFKGQQGDPVEQFVAWMANQNVFLGSWFKLSRRIHPRWIAISQVAFSAKPLLSGDVVMTGDAAGLIIPLAGNGISMALEGGLLAAEHICEFLDGGMGADDLRNRYPEEWSRRFQRRLKIGQMLHPLALNPRLAPWLLRILNTTPGLGDWLVSQTRGKPRPETKPGK